MKNKLINVERFLNIYRKSDEDYEKEILLNIPFNIIASIIPPSEKDPLLYEGYELDKEQLLKFTALIDEHIVIDFDKCLYVLECVGIYDW